MTHTPNDGLVSENMSNANGMIPIIFSKKVALAFAKKSKVLDLLTNDYWEGEIEKEGDRVRIVFPDTNSVQVVTGDACPELQYVTASAQDLVINKQMSFAFAITDKEKAQTQFKNAEDAYANITAQNIAIARAKEIEQAVFNATAYDPSLAPNGVYSFGSVVSPATGYDAQNIYTLITQVKERLIETGAVAEDGTYDMNPFSAEPEDGRGVLLVSNAFHTLLLNAYPIVQATQSGDMVVKDGKVERVAGLEVHVDRLLASALSTTDLPFIAGTKNAITKAQQISMVETIRDPKCFQDIVRGMELYGYMILHPECLVRGVIKAPSATKFAVPTINVGE